jgi:hypothetical protein
VITFPSLRVEGGLFSPDLFENLLRDQLPGQKAQDFGLPQQRDLTNEIAAIYHDARSLWQVFRHRLEALSEDNIATSETRTYWVLPFLRLLGYELEYQPRAFEIDGLTFAISHTLTPSPSATHPTPVHIVGWRQDLGRVAPSGRPRLSPHALVQEYLNRSEALWGIVTNGRVLRLLRDSTFVRRQAYLEFDLEGLFEQERFADFVLLYRLLHRTRLPAEGRAEDCLLEKYYQHAIEQGGRVREHLREGVENCLTLLANGFLAHPQSANLRQWVQREGALALYQQLLRLVYRFLFLLVSEERGLMGSNPLYLNHYGVSRLRRLVENRAAYTDDTDLWRGLCALWKIFQDEQLADLLGVPPLNGELFAHQELDEALITNHDLLSAFWHLSFYDNPPRRINYAALDTEELGSVYESLLDYHPSVIFNLDEKPRFELAPGSERKSTGSYYTPPQLVNELIRSALEPVITERLRDQPTQQAREQALLSIKVCDPACGSGHFLLAAARRLGKELARVRTGEDEPAPEQVRAAVREVVSHCIYGVDKNPLAVELARVALWLESHAEGKPLTFLEHRIRCGDSLVGVLDLSILKMGIPDDAFSPLEGDDRTLAAGLKRQNKIERDGQMTLFGWNFDLELSGLAKLGQDLDTIPDDSPEQVRRKRERYQSRWNDPTWKRLKTACDLWTAAFFQSYTRAVQKGEGINQKRTGEGFFAITTDVLRRALADRPVPPQTLAQVEALAAEVRFFHWPLEFPEIFFRGGFDVILGNPPFNANLSPKTKNWINFMFDSPGSNNTASLFWVQSIHHLSNKFSRIGLVTPKSIIYSTRWDKTRNIILPYIQEIVDCGEAWKNVLLEQVLITANKNNQSSLVSTGRLHGNQIQKQTVSRETFGRFEIWIVDPEPALLKILNYYSRGTHEDWLPLGSILKTSRGLSLQSSLSGSGEIPVIGGRDLSPFYIKSFSGFIRKDQIADFELFLSPKAVFQNIVAFVSRPRPHIKLIGAVDYRNAICLDTVNIICCPSGTFTPEAIVTLLSSYMINWLLHHLAFGFAQRTMHFDQFALDRLIIPKKILSLCNRLDELGKKAVRARGEDLEVMREVNRLLFMAYGLDNDQQEYITRFFENP